jgi:hypothetical protein
MGKIITLAKITCANYVKKITMPTHAFLVEKFKKH